MILHPVSHSELVNQTLALVILVRSAFKDSWTVASLIQKVYTKNQYIQNIYKMYIFCIYYILLFCIYYIMYILYIL